jgi:hypothetical protein
MTPRPVVTMKPPTQPNTLHDHASASCNSFNNSSTPPAQHRTHDGQADVLAEEQKRRLLPRQRAILNLMIGFGRDQLLEDLELLRRWLSLDRNSRLVNARPSHCLACLGWPSPDHC